MNEFVNPKKRSIQLPKGAKDMADVLRANNLKALNKVKCDYCGAPAICVSACFAIPGVMDEKVHGTCEQCVQDESEFAARPENKSPDDLGTDDDAAMEQISKQWADYERRLSEFMRQRVRDRKPK